MTKDETEPSSKPTHDDFDDEFDDLPPPAAVTSSTVPSTNNIVNFDSFEDEFSFPPDFDAATKSTVTPFTSAATAFDDSFADFDANFPPASSTAPTSFSPTTAQPSAFSFDDAFGETPGHDNDLASTLGSPSPSSTRTTTGAPTLAPALPARSAPPPTTAPPTTTTKKGSNAEVELAKEHSMSIEDIVQMGFSRAEAVEALERYDYDRQRAINSLLG